MKKILLILGILSLVLISGCNQNIGQELCSILRNAVPSSNTTRVYYDEGVCVLEDIDYVHVISIECTKFFDGNYAHIIIKYNNETPKFMVDEIKELSSCNVIELS